MQRWDAGWRTHVLIKINGRIKHNRLHSIVLSRDVAYGISGKTMAERYIRHLGMGY